MSELDEVSMHIGQLTGQVEALNSNLEHLIGWVKESNASMKVTMDAHDANDRREFETIRNKIQSLDKFKTKVLTGAAICSLVFTASANYLYHYMFGKGY